MRSRLCASDSLEKLLLFVFFVDDVLFSSSRPSIAKTGTKRLCVSVIAKRPAQRTAVLQHDAAEARAEDGETRAAVLAVALHPPLIMRARRAAYAARDKRRPIKL